MAGSHPFRQPKFIEATSKRVSGHHATNVAAGEHNLLAFNWPELCTEWDENLRELNSLYRRWTVTRIQCQRNYPNSTEWKTKQLHLFKEKNGPQWNVREVALNAAILLKPDWQV